MHLGITKAKPECHASPNTFNLFWAFASQTYSTTCDESSSNLDLRNIEWFALDENGFIKDSNESLQNKAAVYIYQFILDEDAVGRKFMLVRHMIFLIQNGCFIHFEIDLISTGYEQIVIILLVL